MKKFFFYTMLLSFALSACENNNLKSNIIVASELTDREKSIVSFSPNKAFVFDFYSSDYKEVSLWIEKYEFGKLTNEQIGFMTTAIMDNGTIFFTANETNTTPNQVFFNIGVSGEGITNSSTTSDIISNKGNDGLMTVWGSIGEEMDISSGEIVLGSIYYSWGEGPTMSLSDSFYKDVEGQINEIENYDVVYLLKSKFLK